MAGLGSEKCQKIQHRLPSSSSSPSSFPPAFCRQALCFCRKAGGRSLSPGSTPANAAVQRKSPSAVCDLPWPGQIPPHRSTAVLKPLLPSQIHPSLVPSPWIRCCPETWAGPRQHHLGCSRQRDAGLSRTSSRERAGGSKTG